MFTNVCYENYQVTSCIKLCFYNKGKTTLSGKSSIVILCLLIEYH